MAVMIAPTWLPPAGGGATWPGTFEGKYTGPAPHFFFGEDLCLLSISLHSAVARGFREFRSVLLSHVLMR